MTSSAQFEETRHILLRRFETQVRIGVHEFEQQGAQRL